VRARASPHQDPAAERADYLVLVGNRTEAGRRTGLWSGNRGYNSAGTAAAYGRGTNGFQLSLNERGLNGESIAIPRALVAFPGLRSTPALFDNDLCRYLVE